MMRALIALISLVAGSAFAQFDYQLKPVQIAPDVHMFVGKTEDFSTVNGGNIVNSSFIVGTQGVIVIDTGSSLRYGQQMRQAIARVTDKPISLVINTHLHPDHFLGNQAFADVPIAALAATREGIAREGNGFAENLYRLSGDWMKGTEVQAPVKTLGAGVLDAAGRRLRLISLDGHTGADLVIFDEQSGVLFTGDLVFHGRAPTTPHADVAHWFAALDMLEKLTQTPEFRVLVPGHGVATRDAGPIRQTRAWLNWLLKEFRAAAADGLDMNDLLARPLPPEFRDMPVAQTEYRRSVSHLYPQIEQEVLGVKR